MTDPKPDPLRPTQDSRGFFVLPRAARDVGYYNYGTMDKRPDRGGYQYAHPIMMTAILRVAHEWQKIDPRRVGVGNISRADMRDDGEHATHLDGLQVDLRPIRKDGIECPVSCFSAEYDPSSNYQNYRVVSCVHTGSLSCRTKGMICDALSQQSPYADWPRCLRWRPIR